MKEFSMYDLALEAAGSGAEDLGAVTHVSRRDFDERAAFRFSAQAPCLEYISLLIENALVLRTHRGGRVYAGFQRLSRMEGVVDRYMRIADVSERVYVFGEPDWKPPRHPNMRVIELPALSRLAREWFVVADSPSLRVALVGVDEGGSAAPDLEGRTFRAFKTHDPATVQRLASAAEDLIDHSLNS
ncbi:MAG TPA: DICT sensory domain-containing protein [Pyrinomonadaceae bacterium]|nr:DICT sensory domain-containing protein [Pyrinomonadaceae bacterium]